MTERDAAVERRLAAILAADIAGYSALIGADEEATVRNLKGHQSVILPMVAAHKGRIIDTAGDGLLAEFSSVLNAVHCAFSIQSAMAERNLQVEPHKAMRFRIGINIGDVIYDEARIYGDGVNIAARLESIASPGTICISGKVFDEIGDRIEKTFHDIGEKRLKNIAKPVRAYQSDVLDGRDPGTTKTVRTNVQRRMVVPALGGLLVIGGLFTWFQTRPSTEQSSKDSPDQQSLPNSEPESASQRAAKSLAVLPFRTIGEASNDYFSDGLTEDIITDLSRISALHVIARQSSFAISGETDDIQKIGNALGVKFLVTGSIRHSQNRLRVNANLVDLVSSKNIWAERFDATLDDALNMQDKLTREIVAALSVELTAEEQDSRQQIRHVDAAAYDRLLQGLPFLHRFTRNDNVQARTFFEQAVQLDPTYTRAHANLALTHARDVVWFSGPDHQRSIDLAQQALARAREFDNSQAYTPFAAGVLAIAMARYDQAVKEATEAITREPNYADGYALLANAAIFNGEPERSLNAIQKAKKLNPRFPFGYLTVEGHANFLLGRYDVALEKLDDALSRNPVFVTARILKIASYGQLEQIEDAGWEIDELHSARPDVTLQTLSKEWQYRRQEDRERLIEGLRNGGFK